MLSIQGLVPRAYQRNILETAKGNNCLMVLPTGLGKTLVALLLAIERINKLPTSQVLFMAPTRPLAAQHYETFKKHISGLDEEFFSLVTGQIGPKKRKLIWNSASFIFSTPQCVANDLRNGTLSLQNFSLLIEDECHRCLKNYDYVYVAKVYKEMAENARILGLTASPGSDASVISQICKNLSIEAVEVRTRQSEDVKPYVKKLKTEFIRVDLPSEFVTIREHLTKIYNKKIEELKNRGIVFQGQRVTKKTIIELQVRLRRIINAGNNNFNILRGISVLAEIMKVQHLYELLETQCIEAAHSYARELENEAKKGSSKAVKSLVKNPDFQLAITKLKGIYGKQEHPKLEMLKKIVRKMQRQRIMIFAQYRATVKKIHDELEGIGIKSKVFIGQASREMKGLSQKEQQAIIREFSDGKINALVSTSIGEEGLDIPEVNLVIFYEPVPSAIRKIQRAGRTARLKSGKLIVLITRKTRDEAYHYAAFYKERKMHGILTDMAERLTRKQSKKQSRLTEFLEAKEAKI